MQKLNDWIVKRLIHSSKLENPIHFRNDPRINSFLHKRKSNDDDETWDANDTPKMSSPRPSEPKEADKKAEETTKK